jgi:hypothetical protein
MQLTSRGSSPKRQDCAPRPSGGANSRRPLCQCPADVWQRRKTEFDSRLTNEIYYVRYRPWHGSHSLAARDGIDQRSLTSRYFDAFTLLPYLSPSHSMMPVVSCAGRLPYLLIHTQCSFRSLPTLPYLILGPPRTPSPISILRPLQG